jgi:hypothetical protein
MNDIYKPSQFKILVTMNKKQGILLAIALVLLFTGIALATSTTASATSDVIIYAFSIPPP